ncbi:hypothetical protein P7C70_g9481, partial [Phenoliferia sp. Uapishka_3]
MQQQSAPPSPTLEALPKMKTIIPDSSLDYTPRKKIFTQEDIPNWLDSEAYYQIELFIARLSVAVDGKRVEDECHESAAVKAIVTFLEDLTAKIDSIPLDPSPQRFGNKAFRDWLSTMES